MRAPFADSRLIPLPNLIHEVPTFQFDRSIDEIIQPAAGGGGIQFPFQLQNTSTVSGGSPVPKVNVRYGTVMDVEPTNCETDLALTAGQTTIVYIHVVVDINGVMLSTEILTATSQPADTSYDGYITIGNVVVDGGGNVTSVNQAMTHSLRMAMCGRVVTGGVLTTPGTFEFWGF